MIKQLFLDLGYGFWAELALVLFVVAFVSAVVHTMLRSAQDVKEAARIPLEDSRVDQVGQQR